MQAGTLGSVVFAKIGTQDERTTFAETGTPENWPNGFFHRVDRTPESFDHEFGRASAETIASQTDTAGPRSIESRPSIPRPQVDTDAREECGRLARRARDAFKSACDAEAKDDADSHCSAVVDLIAQLWNHALIRDRPFKDLLAALEVALRDAAMDQLDARQRDALRLAFADLPVWHLDAGTVGKHIEGLTEAGIDLFAPVRPKAGKKFRIVIEEVDA